MKSGKIPAFLLTGAIICSAAAFTGCSGGSGSSAGGSPAGQNSTVASSEEDQTPITINITWWGSQTRHDYTKKLLDLYHQKHPNISFSSTPAGYDGYEQKLTTQAAGNALPDIMQMDYSFISEFTQNGSLADLSSFVADKTIDLTDADQSLVDSGKINGKLGAIVIAENAPSIIYNPDVLKQAGVAEPTASWTWNDIVSD